MTKYLIFFLYLFISCSSGIKRSSFFKDSNLEAAVIRSLNKNVQSLTLADLALVRDLNCNNCKDLTGIQFLENLENLSLANSSINSGLECIAFLKKIKMLDLRNCNLKSINFINELSSIQVLYLSDNYLTDISQIATLPNLNTAYFNHNKILNINALATCYNIEYFEAWDNNIEFLPNLSNCKKLNYLDLGHNRILYNINFYALQNVTTLFFDENCINKINWVLYCKKLKCVYLDDNPIPCDGIVEKIRQANKLEVFQCDCD